MTYLMLICRIYKNVAEMVILKKIAIFVFLCYKEVIGKIQC